MPRSKDPEVNFNWINIITFLPGASAEDVEKRITDPLEDAIRSGIEDIRFVSSTSREGISNIFIRFQQIEERIFDKRVIELRREVQNTYNDELPEEAVSPKILEITTANAFPTATVVVTGPGDDEHLRRQVRNIQKDLQRLPGVSRVNDVGLLDPELQVAFLPERLGGSVSVRWTSPTRLVVKSQLSSAATGRRRAAGVDLGPQRSICRLQHHYVMFKEKVEGRRYQGAPFEAPGSVKRVAEPPHSSKQSTTSAAIAHSSTPAGTVIRRPRKVGRNEPCPCGSGKKYKKCCMLKPKHEQSEPATHSDNTSMTTVREENRAEVSTAKMDLDKAEELVSDRVKLQQEGEVGSRLDMAIQRELETTPEIATSLLRLLLARYAPSGRDEEVGQEYHACMHLLEEALTQIRYSVDRKRPWAIKMAEQIQIEIAEQAFRREVDVKLQHDLTFALHEAKLQVHPRIGERQAELAEYYGRFSAGKGAPDLDKLFAKIAEETASNTPFDMLTPMLAEMNLMPLDGQLLMATGMMTSSQTLFNELAVLLLLHPNPEVRSRLPDIFLQVGGVKNITPLSLRRMVGLRNWLPQKERPAVDRLIRSGRLANIASAPLPQAQTVTVHASPFDGAGAQGTWMTYRVKRDYHVVGVLVKQGKGIHEAWQQSGFTKRDVDAMTRDMSRSGGSEQVQTAFLQRLVPHFIAVGLRNNAPPPAQLLFVDEVLGSDYWKPQWVSPAEEIDRLVATEPRSFTPDRVQRVLDISQKWPDQLKIASSWFEDDVRVDELLRQHVGSPSRWLGRIDLASELIREEILEDKRDIWSERLLWMALWAQANQANQARKPLPWQDFLILARELQQGTRLEKIPLMAAIATRSAQSAWQRAQLR